MIPETEQSQKTVSNAGAGYRLYVEVTTETENNIPEETTAGSEDASTDDTDSEQETTGPDTESSGTTGSETEPSDTTTEEETKPDTDPSDTTEPEVEPDTDPDPSDTTEPSEDLTDTETDPEETTEEDEDLFGIKLKQIKNVKTAADKTEVKAADGEVTFGSFDANA